MIITPTKDVNASLVLNLTPIRFLNSPKANNETSSNITVCRNRLELIIKTLQDNYEKWQIAQKRGLSLCSSIEAIKTRSIENAKINLNSSESSLYTKELKPYCDKLSVLTGIFVDITKNAKESLRQLQMLNKMSGASEQVFYRTWKLQQFIEFTENLFKCYELETAIKEFVMREIPHCMSRVDLMRSTTAWEYPQYVDSEIALAFAFLKEEINTEKG